MPSKEFPPKGTGNDEPNPWDTVGQENHEDAQEDLRDDENLPLEERINRSQKRENQLKGDENADEVIASERSFRMSLMEQLRAQNAAKNEVTDINNISDQLDDSNIPDVLGWDDEFHFGAHRENGMEGNFDSVSKKAPENNDDLLAMGYSQEQIDDWTAEGLDPMEEYLNAVPAGGGEDDYKFRANEQNDDNSAGTGAEGNDGSGEQGGEDQGEGAGEEGAENDEKANDNFERGETEPYGDFGSWLKDKHDLSPADLDNLSDDEREKILNEFGAEKGIDMGSGAFIKNFGEGSGEGGGEGSGEGSGEGGGEGSGEEGAEKGETGGEDGGERSKGEEALAFVSLCTERESQLAAHDIAEAMFADRVAHSKNPFKRIIMGNMLKEGVLAHYRKKALEAIVAYNADANDSNKKIDNHTVAQYWSKKGGIERFTKAYMEQVLPAVHARAGENMKGYTTRTDENGEIYVVTKSRNENGDIVETRVDADRNPGAKAAIDIRKAIEAYAAGTSDLASLKEQVRRIQQGEGITDEKLDLSVDNLVELAEAAKQRAEHAEGIINVMEGFSYINGEAMRSVRSESHKTKIEKASEWVSEHTMGLISPEVIGGAASLMLFFADKGARTVAKAVAPGIGGAVIAGAAAGIRERGRVSGDIQTSSREAAMGRDVSGPGGNKGKYDRQVAETLYEMKSAEALTDSLETAIENNDTDAMQKALANIEALINISDSQKVDLIRFSSSENIEDERMNMDIARAKAEVALRKAGVDISNSDTYRDAMNAVRSEISRDMSEKDKARNKLKTKRMFAQGAKTAAISIVAGTAVREISAYFNPNQVGILDHVFNKENNYDATNTPLASFLGLKEPDTIIPGEVSTDTVMYMSGQELTPQQVAEYKSQGFIVSDPKTEYFDTTETTQVNVSEYAQNHTSGGFVRNWLDNGTPESNGNELRGYYTAEHGWHSGMYGESFGGGVTRDFEDDMADGKVHAFFSFSRGSQSTPIQLSERVFTAADGSMQKEFFSEDPTIQSFLDKKMGMVEIASESGRFTEDGTPIMDIWATWPGEDITGTITDTVTVQSERALYNVFQEVTTKASDTVVEGAERLINGIAIFPFASRKALHRAKPLPIAGGRRDRKPTPTPPTPPTPEPTPNPNPEPTPNPNPNPEPTPEPTPTPGPEPTPTPEPNPNPEPTPEPTPNPNPNPEPTPEPTPTPGPEPTPTPTPEPNPNPNPEPTPNPEPNPNPNPNPTPNPNPDRRPNPNNISEQLDDYEIPDVPGWNDNAEWYYRAHRQNGMEQNDDSNSNPTPNPNNISEQLDDNEIPDVPGWNDNAEWYYRAHRQNGMEQNDNRSESAEAADRARQEEIERLRQQIASSRQRENDNSSDDGVVASERSYRQGLLSRLSQLTGEMVVDTDSAGGAGAEAIPDIAPKSAENGFRPDGGGEWTVENLRNIPDSRDYVVSILPNTPNGRSILGVQNMRARFNGVVNDYIRHIQHFNNSRMSAEQKVAILNGYNPEEVGLEPMNSHIRKDVDALRTIGVLVAHK